MKRHLVRLTSALLAFIVGIATSQLLSSSTKQVNTTPLALEQVATEPVFSTSVPTTVLPVVATRLETKPQTILDYNPKRFEPYGFYAVVGKKPKEFPGLQGIDLSLWRETSGEIEGEITLIFSDGSESPSLTSSFALVTNKKIFIATRADSRTDIEYRFEGTFLRGGVVSDAPENEVVLQGTLTKSKNGLRVAERFLKFTIVVDHC